MTALRLLFSAIIKHGKVPNSFNSCILLPMVKDKCEGWKDVTNCRPKRINPFISWHFESCAEYFFFIHIYIFLLSLSIWIWVNVSLYMYIYRCIYSKAIFTFIRTIEHFVNNEYIYSLDACKAWDNVCHYAFFSSMIRRGVPLSLINTFVSYGIKNWVVKFTCIFNTSDTLVIQSC